MKVVFLKNMVCDRCKMVVKAEFEKLGIIPLSVELGRIELGKELPGNLKPILKSKLESIGFIWIDDKISQKTNHIKSIIIELVHNEKLELKTNLSDFLVNEVGEDYAVFSKQFSDIEGVTIEKFFIQHRIEKVKELLTYNELTLSEIAFRLNFSSVAHLSNQFKQIVGETASNYRQKTVKSRNELDLL